MTADQFFKQFIDEIAVPIDEIDAARDKRDELAAHVLEILAAWGLPGRRWFPTGAVAMGTVIAPLNDIDLAVTATARRSHWADDPKAALDEIAAELRIRLPGCKVETSAHAVKVTYPDEGFTADVVFGLEMADHLLIPHCPADSPREHGWIKTNPARHAELVRARNKQVGHDFARTVRILKALNRKWGMEADDEKKPLSSWHLTALAITLITSRVSYATTIPAFLEAASKAVLRPLRDPTGVGPDLETRKPQEASARMARAVQECRRAAAAADAEPILRELFGSPAAAVAAVTGKPVSFAGGALVVGLGGRGGPGVRSYGDAA